ncbi:MAG: PKD domain-containing protein [Candidatus Peribacteraceae bacterium]|nr:PKD domain-containing protein [Candidatus Peribacteraceae bacterium]
MKFQTKIGIFALVFAFLASSASAELFSGSGVGPTASFTATPTAAVTGNTVSFDASASRNARGTSSGLQYRWDFEGKYEWTNWSSYSKTSYIFNENRDFTARLQVKDSDGLVDETAATITVATKYQSSAPLAKIHVDPESGDTTTNFHFTVEVFSNIHTSTDRLEVRWDWNHDGVWDTDWSRAREFFHVFPDALYQEVWLEVRDIDGSSSTEKGIYVEGKENDSIRSKEIGLIHVVDVTAPIASFETWPVEIDQNINVHFDASDSIRVTDYRWDFDGDGRFDNSWSSNNKEVQHTYRDVGVFDAILEVRNSSGETDTTTRTISVTDQANILPTASFTMRNLTNTALGSRLAVLRDEIRFSATGSRDEDGSANKLQTRWDFDGDGIFDTTFSTEKTAVYKFTSTGTKYPLLQVRDELGGLATVTSQIEIVANTAPRAGLTVTPTADTPGSYFRFDASATRDDQTGTSNLEYRFDFDGDGLFDTEFESARSYSRKITRTGQLTATVEVRDHTNATSRATDTFTVVSPREPVAGFVVEPRVGTFSTNFEFDASASSDPTGLGERLNYRWDFDYRGEDDVDFSTGWSASSIYHHRFSEVGDHSIRLVVRNSAGLEDDVFGKIKVHEQSAALQYVRQKGIITTEENPDALITRAELAKIIVKAAGITAATPRIQQFTDVPTNTANARYISAVYTRGWISPRANFAWQPDGSVNRAEAAKVVISALYPRVATLSSVSLADVPESAWYARFAETAVAEDLVKSDDSYFNPAAPVTRAEIARMVAILLERYSLERRYANLIKANNFEFHAAAEASSAREFFAKILSGLGLTD